MKITVQNVVKATLSKEELAQILSDHLRKTGAIIGDQFQRIDLTSITDENLELTDLLIEIYENAKEIA